MSWGQVFWSGVALLLVAPVVWFVAALVKLILQEQRFRKLEDTSDLEARIARRSEGFVAKRSGVRLVVGILQGDRSCILDFGTGRPEAVETPSGALVYEIGSITKVFTGILLARAEIEGRLGLDDPIGPHFPPDWDVPEPIRAITFRQLATHTSGLARLPDNLDATVRDEANPYANYRSDDLRAYLRTARLKRPPGRRSEYSNLGVGLLGELLARLHRRSYGESLRESVLTPLGLHDTDVTPTQSMCERLVAGHDEKCRLTSGWDFDVLAPAGALCSTADEMLRFLTANLRDEPVGTEEQPIDRALRRARETQHPGSFGSRTGLCWQIEEDMISKRTFHWHNGGTGGYRSFLGLDTERNVGVVLLSNFSDAMSGEDAVDAMGFEFLRLATRVSLKPEAGMSGTSAGAASFKEGSGGAIEAPADRTTAERSGSGD